MSGIMVAYNPEEIRLFYIQYYRLQSGAGISVYKGRRIMDDDSIQSMISQLLKSGIGCVLNTPASVPKHINDC